jgi:signal transduction histidine kinase
MDIILKGEIDGIEAANQIRIRYNIPVVFLTAYSDEKTLHSASITQPFGYLVKPFEDKVLHTTIQIALFRQKATVELQKALALSEELRKETEAKSELKSQYVSMASHEFRTPLCVIQSLIEILQNYGDKCSDEKKQKYLRHMQEAANTMNQLVEDILMIEETDYGQLELHTTSVNVVTFCQEIIEFMKLNLSERHQLTFTSYSNCLEAILDERLLWHILSNLLSNAIKYSPQGGQIYLTLSCQNHQICFQVQDQGIGISAEDQKRLFKPFSRATNVGQIRGTGLGLSIVKRSVELQRGQITVESEVGQGTTFTVTLPWVSPNSL